MASGAPRNAARNSSAAAAPHPRPTAYLVKWVRIAVPPSSSSAVRTGLRPAQRAPRSPAGPEGLADHVGQQPEKAGALDRLGQLTLLGGGDRRDAGGHDLAALGDVARQQAGVLVVDLRRIGTGKRAGLAAAEKRAAGGGRHQKAPAWASSRGRRGGRSGRSPRGGRGPPKPPRSSRSASSRLRNIAEGPASCSPTRTVMKRMTSSLWPS